MVTYTAPAPGSTTDTNTVAGKVTDVGGVASLVGQVDSGQSFAVTVDAAGNFSFATSLLLNGTDDGPHTVHLIATDKAGNVSGTFDDSFVLDTTPVLADPNLAAAVRFDPRAPLGSEDYQDGPAGPDDPVRRQQHGHQPGRPAVRHQPAIVQPPAERLVAPRPHHGPESPLRVDAV